MEDRLRLSVNEDPIDLRPAIWTLKMRFMEAGLHRWDNHRVKALCDRIKITPFVLCANLGLYRTIIDSKGILDLKLHSDAVKTHWSANQWPVHLALGFDRLEAFLDDRPSVQSVSTSELFRSLKVHHG